MKTTIQLTLAILSLGMASFAQEQAPAVTHNTWTSGAAMPTALWAPGGVGTIKGQIYVVGGCTNSGVIADTQIYSPASNAWSTGVPVPTAVCGGVAAVVKNVLYLIGGTVTPNGTSYTNAVWAFNPKTKTWSPKSSMPIAREGMGVAVENNVIYVVGGNGTPGLRLTTVESYNPATDTWTEEAPLPVGKSEPSVGRIGTTIVAADGYATGGDTGDNEGYNATTNSWTSLNSDPTARNAACVGSVGPQVIVAGGYSNGATNLTESFKPSKNKWKTLAAEPQQALSAGSAVYKGHLYCFGGVAVFQGAALNNVQIYQP